MAHGGSGSVPLMDLRVVALYPTRISGLADKAGVRFRRRKKLWGTMVPCQVRTLNGRSIAVPAYAIADGTPSPRYRVQIEIARAAVDDRRAVYVLLSAEPEAAKMDPEQTLMAPIFDDGHRMIFEFQRAHVLSVTQRGDVEMRLVAVHPILGIVGTKTVYRFHTRLSPLAMRCTEYVAGAVDLFPFRERPTRMSRFPVPEGEADLSFDSGFRSTSTRKAEADVSAWPAGTLAESATEPTQSVPESSDGTAL